MPSRRDLLKYIATLPLKCEPIEPIAVGETAIFKRKLPDAPNTKSNIHQMSLLFSGFNSKPWRGHKANTLQIGNICWNSFIEPLAEQPMSNPGEAAWLSLQEPSFYYEITTYVHRPTHPYEFPVWTIDTVTGKTERLDCDKFPRIDFNLWDFGVRKPDLWAKYLDNAYVARNNSNKTLRERIKEITPPLQWTNEDVMKGKNFKWLDIGNWLNEARRSAVG